MAESARDLAEHGWVSGRVKESADGLNKRPQDSQRQERLREKAAKEAAEQIAGRRGRGRRL